LSTSDGARFLSAFAPPTRVPGTGTAVAGFVMMGERLRVIVALADAFEGAAVYDGLLSAGFDPAWCSNVREVGDAMRAQPFDLVIADVSLALDGRLQSEGRARNPLTPIILIGDPGSRPVSWSGRTMHLTRPVDQAMLTCFVTMALHQDKPVRRSVRKRVNPIQAVVNGVPAHILDVSAEGLRLELPGGRRSVLPPMFTVRLPLADLALTVQRRWTRSESNSAQTIWYGGALSQNRASIEQRWRIFMDTLPVVSEGHVSLVG
jgi:hypothetical protein